MYQAEALAAESSDATSDFVVRLRAIEVATINISPPQLQYSEGASFTPSQVVNLLDKHIVGQADAKRAVANALRSRWRRRRVPSPMRVGCGFRRRYYHHHRHHLYHHHHHHLVL